MTDISFKLFNLKYNNRVNLKKSIEVTKHFSNSNKNDPVKYDFSLTRFGINREFKKEDLFINILKL